MPATNTEVDKIAVLKISELPNKYFEFVNQIEKTIIANAIIILNNVLTMDFLTFWTLSLTPYLVFYLK